MDERTKELSSQLSSSEEEKTDAGKADMEELEDDEDEEETKEDEKNDAGEKEETEDVVDEPEETEDKKGKKEAQKTVADDKKPEEENKDEEDAGESSKKDKQDRWHGKSREEVIRSYEELEKQAEESKNKKSENTEESEKPEIQQQKKTVNELEIPSDEELAKMTPKGFAEWMIKTVGKMVDKTYDTRSQLREAVTTEIREAQKDHPLLKSNPEYRELILTVIDAAAQKGTVMPLKEACVKVDAIIGRVKGDDNKATDEDKARLKKAKAQVERGAGAPASPGEEKGAEQKRLESIFGTGRSKSPFGGLGV